MLKLIGLTILASTIDATFRIIRSTPTRLTHLRDGDSLTLSCTTSNWWEFCTFNHLPSGRTCDFVWTKAAYNVTVTDCSDFEGRFSFSGDYNLYECGVTIANVRKADSGEWDCSVEEYMHGFERGDGAEATQKFDVAVQVNEDKEEEDLSTFNDEIGTTFLGCYRNEVPFPMVKVGDYASRPADADPGSPSNCLDACRGDGFSLTFVLPDLSCWCGMSLSPAVEGMTEGAFHCRRDAGGSDVGISVYQDQTTVSSIHSNSTLSPESSLSSNLELYNRVTGDLKEMRKKLRDSERDLERAKRDLEAKRSIPVMSHEEMDKQISQTLSPLAQLISAMETERRKMRDEEMRVVMLQSAITVETSNAAFEVVQSNPKTIKTSGGSQLTLLCTVNRQWGLCTFEHLPSKNFCEFAWNDETNNVTISDCQDLDKRSTFVGDLNKYECGITITNMTEGDAGVWQCRLEELWGWDDFGDDVKEASEKFDIVVSTEEEDGVEDGKENSDVNQKKGLTASSDVDIGATYLGCYHEVLLWHTMTLEVPGKKSGSISDCLDYCRRMGGFSLTLIKLDGCWCGEGLPSHGEELKERAFDCREECVGQDFCGDRRGTVGFQVFEEKSTSKTLSAKPNLSPSLEMYYGVAGQLKEMRRMLNDAERDLEMAKQNIERHKSAMSQYQDTVNNILSSCPDGSDALMDEELLDDQISETLLPLSQLMAAIDLERKEKRASEINMVMLERTVQDIKKEIDLLNVDKEEALGQIFTCSLPVVTPK